MKNSASTKPNRRSIRLPGYDYSQEGAYFVTLVTAGRETIFGAVSVGEMALNEFGEIISSMRLIRTADIRDNVGRWVNL